LTADQIEAIRSAAAETFGSEARIWLFGSRADDSKRGGDIDLLIQSSATGSETEKLTSKIRFLNLLQKQIGDRKVDVVLETEHDQRPIVRLAHQTGVEL
jgi:predicted nucleotidyltransferase